jgi:transposase-like protein
LRTRRRFSAEFKETAVQWLASRPVAEVARICEVSVSVLHRWRRKLGDHAVTPAEGRRRFTREFKAAALEKLDRLERGRAGSAGAGVGSKSARVSRSTVTQVAAALEVPPNTLHRWRKEAREFGGQAFSGYGKSRAAPRPARVVKISLHPGEYQQVRAAFENSSARSLPDFTRSRLLAMTIEPDVERDVRYDGDRDAGQGYAEIHGKLADLAGILRRMALIYRAIYRGTCGATCDSSSQSADSHADRSRPARSHAAG